MNFILKIRKITTTPKNTHLKHQTMKFFTAVLALASLQVLVNCQVEDNLKNLETQLKQNDDFNKVAQVVAQNPQVFEDNLSKLDDDTRNKVNAVLNQTRTTNSTSSKSTPTSSSETSSASTQDLSFFLLMIFLFSQC